MGQGVIRCCLHAFLLDVCKRFGAVVAGVGPSQSSGNYGDHALITVVVRLTCSPSLLQNPEYFHKKRPFKNAMFSKESKEEVLRMQL
jgi:hypothetical protein